MQIRQLTILHGAVPAASVLFPLLIGQLLATASASLQVAGFLCLLLVGATEVGRRSRVIWPCMLGLLLGVLSAPPPPGQPLAANRSYLVRVEGAPAYWAPGAQTVPFALIAEVREKGNLVPFDRIENARCTMKHLPWRNGIALRPGHLLVIRGEFIRDPSSGLWRCRVLFASKEQGVPSFTAQLRGSVRDELERVLGVGEHSGLLLAMLFGFREAVSAQTEHAFRAIGLAHLLVVSGYQVTIVFYCALGVLRWVFRRMQVALKSGILHWLLPLMALAPTTLFVVIVGVDAPNIRATIALLLVVTLGYIEQFSTRLNVIASTAVCMLILWPGCYREPSVQLTFAALLGLAIGELAHRPWSKMLLGCSAASVLAGAVGALWFGEWNVLALLANPVIAPLVSLVSCPIALCGIAVYLIGIDPAGLVLNVVCWLLGVLSTGVQAMSHWPTVRLDGPEAFTVAAILILASAWAAFRGIQRRRGVLLPLDGNLERGLR